MRTFATAMTAVFLISVLTVLTDWTVLADSYFQLPQVSITALKEQVSTECMASAVTVMSGESLRRDGIYRPNALSGKVPGLHIPDYGASLTSTVYIRGLGSRMENPVMALYIDGIPVLDKNIYDFDWEGISNATMLCGPQGTLYGRNAMGGVLSLSTLTPQDDARPTLNLEYGTAGTVRAGASFITGSHTLSATYRHTDGYFMNTCKNAKTDPYDGLAMRWRWQQQTGENTVMRNLLMVNVSSEGGFAYGQWYNDTLHPVSYNDEGSYRRLSAIEGFHINRHSDKLITQGTVSLQLLSDDMHMDQDYTSRSVFTLQQRQNSGAGTLELNLRRADTEAIWQPQTGVFAFCKRNRLEAPVTFKRDGIEDLILKNANSHIPPDIGYLAISDTKMPVNSNFMIDSWNAALFHESVIDLDRWLITAGIRLDYEGGNMDYDCKAIMHYRFAPVMTEDRELTIPYKGSISHSRVELLPKLSALFKATDHISFYATISKGYRAGGFNTQIFSDILQNLTMNATMQDLGVYLDQPAVSVGADNTEYDPETAWNTELGARFNKAALSASAAVYHIDVQNQQLTVFPPGKSTGRMMTNAGRSRSIGIEAEIGWNPGQFRSHISYAWCDARFVKFNDGNNDYSGNRIPYVPEHTLNISAGYSFNIGGRMLDIDATLSGAGPFNWNESGTQTEPFRLRADSRIALVSDQWELYVQAYNLSNADGRSFYFKSVGNEFFASVKPRIIMTGITIKL